MKGEPQRVPADAQIKVRPLDPITIRLSSVRSSIVVFRSAKARSFRSAKGDYRIVIPRTILTSPHGTALGLVVVLEAKVVFCN